MSLIFIGIFLTAIVVFTVALVIKLWFDGEDGIINIILKTAMSLLCIFVVIELVALWIEILGLI